MKYILRDKKEMKDSCVEWVTEIPKGWDIRRLKFLAKVQASNIDKKEHENEESVLLCNYTDVYNNETILQDMKFMRATASKNQIIKLLLKPGDVLATKDSESADDIFVPAIVESSLDNLVCGYHLYHIRTDNEQLYSPFFFRYLQGHLMKVYAENHANGVTRFGISQAPVLSIPVALPNPKEQKHIADFLDEKTAVIDEVVKKKKKQIELLKEKRAALITQAVTKGLDPNVKMKDSGVEWIGEIPEEWQLIRLRRIVSLNPSKQEAKHIPDETKVSFLPMAKVSSKGLFDADNVLKKIDVSSGFTYFKNGDVITAKITPCFENGKGALVYGLVNGIGFGSTEFIVIRPSDNIDGKYLYYLIHSDLFRKSGEPWMYGSAGQQRVPDRFIKEFEAPLPSIEEQKEIVEQLDQKLSMLDEALKKIQKSIKLIQEYRSSLISHAVTGKIHVT